jgi:integrase
VASVFEKNGNYYLRWKDAAGRWRKQISACHTKRDAQRDADDLERKAERQSKGLEPLIEDAPQLTFAQLFEWWWKEYGSRLRGDNEPFARKRLLPALGGFALVEVTAARIEGALQGMSDELAPKSLNGLRGNIHTIFARAIERGVWLGQNPAKAVKRRKVPRKVFDTLRADEVPLLLAALTPQWRPLFASAVYTGLRKGELLGLRKTDVDLAEGTITVRRSYDYETTKGGHADVLPIALQLVPFLEQAFEDSTSQLVFPAADGSMRTDETDLQQVLRRAMGRAGLVHGYLHVCRRKRCGYEEQAKDAVLRHCPDCKMKLWPKAMPRHLRFHDLRGTTATLLARAGVPLVVAQRMLRHADPRLTANVYTRVDLADMRAGIARLPSLVPVVSPEPGSVKSNRASTLKKLSELAGENWSGRQDSNLRPPGPEPGALPG